MLAGRVGRPHGLDGSFHVVEPVASLLVEGARLGGLGEIVGRKGADSKPIIRITGVTTREAADALRGETLEVLDVVEPALEADEYLASDLEGCEVVSGDADGTSSHVPRNASAASRSDAEDTRTIGRSSVPLRPTIEPRSPPSTVPTSSSDGTGDSTWNEPSSPCGRPTRPARIALVDDVDEDALVLAHGGRLDERAQRVGGPAAAADHAAVVVIVDGELENHGAVRLLELLDLDRLGLRDEHANQIEEERFQRAAGSMPCVRRSFLT